MLQRLWVQIPVLDGHFSHLFVVKIVIVMAHFKKTYFLIEQPRHLFIINFTTTPVWIRIRILGVEGKHADHLTTTLRPLNIIT